MFFRSVKKEHILDTPVPASHEEYTPMGEHEYYVLVLMQIRIAAELGKYFPHFPLPSHGGMALFSNQVCIERYRITSEILNYKLVEGGSMSEHKSMITDLLRKLENIKCPMSNVQAVDTILRSLPPSYNGLYF